MDRFVGEIRLFAGDYAPEGWALCNGQFLRVNDNQPLFSIIYYSFGRDAEGRFALPDLRGRVPMNVGPNYVLGANGGKASHTLTIQEMPGHHHDAYGMNATGSDQKGNNLFWANTDSSMKAYSEQSDSFMSSGALQVSGSGEAHPNMQPYLVLNFCIATSGLYPPRP
jgi:microcystin-dependent protein